MVGLAIPYNNQSSTQTGDYAISLDGVDEYIEVWGNLPAQENDFTYEAWIYPESSSNELGFIFSMGSFPNQYHIQPQNTFQKKPLTMATQHTPDQSHQ